jgi:hypothetical protein
VYSNAFAACAGLVAKAQFIARCSFSFANFANRAIGPLKRQLPNSTDAEESEQHDLAWMPVALTRLSTQGSAK